MSTLLDLAGRIESMQFAVAIVESRFAFATIEGIHLVALSVSVGLIFLTDLRLIGALLRHVPILDVLHHLRLYVLGGFAVVFITGALLFWAEAVEVLESPATPFKFAFMLVAGINALYFELVIAKRPAFAAARTGALPASARAAGYASLGLWTLVIICGRLIAYLPHWH